MMEADRKKKKKQGDRSSESERQSSLKINVLH